MYLVQNRVGSTAYQRAKTWAPGGMRIGTPGWGHVEGEGWGQEPRCGRFPNDTCGTDSKPSHEHRLGVLSVVTGLGTRVETGSE